MPKFCFLFLPYTLPAPTWHFAWASRFASNSSVFFWQLHLFDPVSDSLSLSASLSFPVRLWLCDCDCVCMSSSNWDGRHLGVRSAYSAHTVYDIWLPLVRKYLLSKHNARSVGRTEVRTDGRTDGEPSSTSWPRWETEFTHELQSVLPPLPVSLSLSLSLAICLMALSAIDFQCMCVCACVSLNW